MTAATTPRLGLMLPSSSDNFTIADFDATFSKLDSTPGITPVANFAALPSGLTSAQHGSVYMQTDNGSQWMWNKPGSGAGSWKKINTVGLLASATQGSAVSTSATDLSSGAVLISLNYTAAGGRRVFCFFSHPLITNSGSYGASQTGIFQDSGGALEVSRAYSGTANRGVSHRMLQDLGAPAAGTTHNVTVKMASVSSSGNGTTSTEGNGQLYIWEI